MERYRKSGKARVAGKRIELVARDINDREFPVELAIIPVTPGESSFFTAYLRDISQQREVEHIHVEHEKDLRRILLQTVSSVSRTIEMRDPYTSGHQQRVAQLSAAIAKETGCSDSTIEGISIGASIHDIGKIAIPGEILTRPGRLDKNSFGLVQSHSIVGYNITKDIEFPWPIAKIILQHHERLDGTGYPNGIKGDEIIPEARIVAVADMVEAIMSHRPYRPGQGVEKALEIIKFEAGVKLDAEYVQACVNVFENNNFEFKPFSDNPLFEPAF